MTLNRFILIGWLSLSPSAALAWDFGRRIKGPDYLDPYLFGFGTVMGLCFVIVGLTKPKGMPMHHVRRRQLPWFTRLFHPILQVSALGFFLILFGGGAIYRYERDWADAPQPADATPRVVTLSSDADSGSGARFVQVPQDN